MKTLVLVEVTHAKPIAELASLIAGRAWTIEGVEKAEIVPSFTCGANILPETQQIPSNSVIARARKELMKKRLIDFFNETEAHASPLDDPRWIRTL